MLGQLRLAARMLVATPAFTVIAVLALGTAPVALLPLGLALGFAGSLMLTGLIRSELEGISPHDPLSFSIVSIVLLGVGLRACDRPVRAAMRLDPMEALRYE